MPSQTSGHPTAERLAVSLQSFGEATSVPVRIRRAAFQVCPAPAIRQQLVQLELTVVNDKVERDISAKLSVPLPAEATLCRFEFLRGGEWYPAVPVEAKAAREVVYKEKEKGREVGAASQQQGNVFEIEISPLGYNSPAQCRLWYSCCDASLAFDFGPDTEVDVVTQPGQEPGASDPTDMGACAVGDCFGQRHFACFVPYAKPPEEVAAAAPKRIAILWDTSGSQEGDHKLRFERLRELASRSPQTSFDVWTFGIDFRREAVSVGVEEAITVLASVLYDGGTDLTLLSSLLAAVGPVEDVMLFSDGMDSLDRRPSIQGASPRVHCVVDQAKVSLQTLSAVSLATGGRLLRGDYLQMFRPQVLLTGISTDQEDEAFFDPNDAFKCCPDHRLHLQWPVGEEGLWLCGTAGAVRRLTAELSVGGEAKAYDFDLAAAPVLAAGAAPLLGYLFARQQYGAVERDGAAMGLDLGVVRAELATRYGFCSPEASLLMLYSAEQFLEHRLDCPQGHPARAAWEQRRAAGRLAAPAATGGPGQPKTEEQMRTVGRLAQELRGYMREPLPPQQAQDLRSREARMKAAAAGGRPSCAAARAGGGMLRMRMMADCDAADDSSDDASDGEDLEDEGYMRQPLPPQQPRDLRSREARMKAAAAGGRPRCAAARAGGGMPRMRMMADCDAADDSSDDASDGEDLEDEGRRLGGAMSGGLGCMGGGLGGKGKGKGNRGSSTGGEGQGCEAYAEGEELGYLQALRDALQSGSWQEVYAKLRRSHAASPSFFLYSAGVVLQRDAEAASRICSNCLEISLQDVQMMRSVGYFLIKAGRSSLGLAVLDRVRELAPAEPQSFLDGALARAAGLLGGARCCERALREAVELAAVVVARAWAERFAEVEWPALVLLHMLLEVAERHGLEDLWPASLGAELRCPDFRAGLVVWLAWDTDKTDIDLHVVEPSGTEVMYSNKRSDIGGHLSKDFTEGYGPEVYLLKDPPAGSYTVKAKYYASHQESSLTGATSAVIWALRGGSSPELQFDTVRLDLGKLMMDVMTVDVDGETAALEFTDTDGDVVRLAREGAQVREYVNGELEAEALQRFHIDRQARSYADGKGSGGFRPEEDLRRLGRLVYQLFAAARQAAAAA